MCCCEMNDWPGAVGPALFFLERIIITSKAATTTATTTARPPATPPTMGPMEDFLEVVVEVVAEAAETGMEMDTPVGLELRVKTIELATGVPEFRSTLTVFQVPSILPPTYVV